jgi:hypothetical protein
MPRKYLPLIVATLASLCICSTGRCQSAPDRAPDPVKETVSAPETPAQSTASPVLNGSAEQQAFVDPPFREATSLIETPPIKGRASALNWMLMPNVGKGTFDHWMKEAHPDFYLSAEKNDPNALIEMVGEHEALMAQRHVCGIDCRRILMAGEYLQASTTRRLLIGRPPKVLVYEVNCSCSLNNPLAVRQFVKDGGFLIVTGRDLHGVQEAFPGRVASANGSLPRDELVDAELLRPDQVLSTNLVTNARWYIPLGFPPIKVLNRAAVRVLCTSRQLAEEVPDGQGVLAAIFPYGRGYVLCLVGTVDNSLGHINTDSGVVKFNLREALPDPAPKVHISLRQGIAANFIEAGLTKTRIPTGISPLYSQAP